MQIWRFTTRLCDLRNFELNEQGNTEIMIECCAEKRRRRRRRREEFFLISHIEHNLLLASLCLFFSPSAYAHASPVSFWFAYLPAIHPPSSSPAHCLSVPPPASLKRVTPLISWLCAWERERGRLGRFH